MEITYTDTRNYTQQQIQELFQSVHWISANYPERLVKALGNCETVITAWDKERLVGLINAMDDGELTAYVHYLLIDPDYQGKGIGTQLLAQIKEKYKDYLYLMLHAENTPLVEYYEIMISENGGCSCNGDSKPKCVKKCQVIVKNH